MSHTRALQKVNQLKLGQDCYVDFITPPEACMLAATKVTIPHLDSTKVNFSYQAMTYATICGLRSQLQGEYEQPTRVGLQGRTYSALTRLIHPEDVSFCNGVIGDLIHSQFSTFPKHSLSTICHVVGELHDNVASHASGVGFSFAQKIGSCLHFAIADCGIGMGKLVRKAINPSFSDEEAVLWCVERGNTTAGSPDDGMAQRLPHDSQFSPYPDNVTTRSSENNHMGEGLWQLRDLVKGMGGELFISSGKANLQFKNDGHSVLAGNYTWQGVSISFTLQVQDISELDAKSRAELDLLSDRLGIFE